MMDSFNRSLQLLQASLSKLIMDNEIKLAFIKLEMNALESKMNADEAADKSSADLNEAEQLFAKLNRNNGSQLDIFRTGPGVAAENLVAGQMPLHQSDAGAPASDFSILDASRLIDLMVAVLPAAATVEDTSQPIKPVVKQRTVFPVDEPATNEPAADSIPIPLPRRSNAIFPAIIQKQFTLMQMQMQICCFFFSCTEKSDRRLCRNRRLLDARIVAADKSRDERRRGHTRRPPTERPAKTDSVPKRSERQRNAQGVRRRQVRHLLVEPALQQRPGQCLQREFQNYHVGRRSDDETARDFHRIKSSGGRLFDIVASQLSNIVRCSFDHIRRFHYFPLQDNVNEMAWSGDGQMLATGSQAGYVQLWNRQGSDLFKLKNHSEDVHVLKWNPKGTLLASGGVDHRIVLWDAVYFQNKCSFTSQSGPILGLHWQSDDTFVYHCDGSDFHLLQIGNPAAAATYNDHKVPFSSCSQRSA